MNRLALIIFAAFTTSVAFLKLAESSADPALHKLEINDDEEEEGEVVEKSSIAQLNTPTFTNTNRLRPQLQASIPSSSRPTLLPIDVVECHVCTDCPRVIENTTSKLCPHTWDVTRQNRCVIYAEQYKHMKRSWYIRGCASERGSCDDIKKAHATHSDIVQLTFCHECEGDKCNSNSGFRSVSDVILALIAMVISPILAKYTLS